MWWQLVWENHSSGKIISSGVDNLSGRVTEVEHVPRDKETACLRKPFNWINYHSSSPPVFCSQLSIISLKRTEKRNVYKIRSLVVQSF